MLSVIAKLPIKEGKMEEIILAFKELMAQVAKEEGTVSYPAPIFSFLLVVNPKTFYHFLRILVGKYNFVNGYFALTLRRKLQGGGGGREPVAPASLPVEVKSTGWEACATR